ncbi:hypothetical protein OO012_13215 [Rhodobacteraceae bacterium KMM 6894]|nr:hypothetical protein [Rhodobacteraceae bacterium KMM 6894]
MFSKCISLIVGAAMAITSFTAAPASAGDKDLARALAAIAGVALIGAAVSNSSNRNNGHVSARGNHNNGYYQQPRHAPQKVYRNGHQQRRAIATRSYHKGYNDRRAQVQQHRAQKHYSAQKHNRAHDRQARRNNGRGH